jgi:tRNA dimethylallyltransferase
VIAGPTGSGKSALALRLAETFRGEVVNCDSLQLYQGFDIGAAKLPPNERRGIPHHMIDVLQARQVYSAGDYTRDARAVIAEISARDRLPIVTGGTGFYLRALLNGLPPLPARDEILRAKLGARESRRPGSLHRLLSRLDPAAAARINVRDIQKSIRALEIRLLTDRPIPPSSEAEPLRNYTVLKLGLDPDRAALYEVLDARATEMFRNGLIEEVRALLAGATGDEKPFEALGYKQALAFLRGSLPMEQAIDSTKIETRQYAKRQWTWFRRDSEIVWLRGFGHDVSVIEQALELTHAYVRN